MHVFFSIIICLLALLSEFNLKVQLPKRSMTQKGYLRFYEIAVELLIIYFTRLKNT